MVAGTVVAASDHEKLWPVGGTAIGAGGVTVLFGVPLWTMGQTTISFAGPSAADTP